ncbi:MAG: hypothetical protein ACREGF_02055 [Candidatus Saccharimonadales bacterium]
MYCPISSPFQIAATAIVNDFTLIANNDKDVKRVRELKYFNPMTAG